MRKHHFLKRLLTMLLAAMLLCQPLFAVAEDEAAPETIATVETADAAEESEETDENAPKYYAFSAVALKVRKEPDKNSTGVGSIPKGSTVYILSLVNDNWAYITFDRGNGYVQTQYLQNMTSYDGAPIETERSEQPFDAHIEGFTAHFKSHTVKAAKMYESADTNSKTIANIPIYTEVIVSQIDGDWAYATYRDCYGFIPVSSLFKWDRLTVDAGDIPGLDVMQELAFVNKPTDILDPNTNKVLQTINPGAALAVFQKDSMGRYLLPYERQDGFISEEDVAYTIPVVPWEEAQPGDLIACFSTYFAVGISSPAYQGRNWNIHLASSMISGVTLEPNENYDQYQIIGPYRKSTGYHAAPIMKKDATMGYGGGTCQVNTTFYLANIQVPMMITHRKVHAEVGIYYVPQGFDAAVGGGNINLTLYNSLPYRIRYQMMNSDGVLTCCIFRDVE